VHAPGGWPYPLRALAADPRRCILFAGGLKAAATWAEPPAASTDPAGGSPSPAFGIPGAGLLFWCRGTFADTWRRDAAVGSEGFARWKSWVSNARVAAVPTGSMSVVLCGTMLDALIADRFGFYSFTHSRHE
jgi:hypothetical protein